MSPGSGQCRLGPAPHPGEPRQRARRVPCGDPHQPPTSPRSPGGGPGPARGRRRSASCGGRCGPHGPPRSLTTQPHARHAASARATLARAPHPPLPRPAPPERIARAAAGTRCPPPAARAPPPCPQGGLRAGPLPRAPSGAGAMDAAPCSFQKPCLQGAQSRRLQPRADDAEANAAELCWAGRG